MRLFPSTSAQERGYVSSRGFILVCSSFSLSVSTATLLGDVAELPSFSEPNSEFGNAFILLVCRLG